MLSRLLDPRDGMPRDPAYWLVLAAIVATQLLAFYVVCVHQVRDAPARRALATVQQVAQVDCTVLRKRAGAGNCSVPQSRAGQTTTPGVMAIGVSYR